MSLKDLISTLIESAFTSKKVFITNTSAPNWTGKITIYNGTSANPVTQTAPADGYYQQHVNGYPSQGYNDISAPNETRAFVANMPESSAMIRVAKGDKVVMSVISFDSIISRTIAFIPCIGGGLSSIIQSGGALCLRLKTIFNRCSNSLARKHCRAVRALIFRSLPRVSGVKLLQPHLMAMLRHTFSTQKRSKSQTLQRKLEQKTRQTYRQELIYPFAKVISLMCTSITRIQLMPFLNLLRRSALLSFTQEVCHG